MPCARSRRAFAGVPAKPATRMPCRSAAATTTASGLPGEWSSSSASTVVPRARARSSGPTNRPSTPGRRRDGVDVGQGTDGLDHDEASHGGVRRGRVGRGSSPQRRERPPAALPLGRVARGTGREHGIRPARHGGHDDGRGTGVQRGSDPDRVDGRHAHDERGPGVGERPAGRVEHGAVDGPVLGVDRHPVEPAGGQAPQQVDVARERPDAARGVGHPDAVRCCRPRSSSCRTTMSPSALVGSRAVRDPVRWTLAQRTGGGPP